MPKKTRDPRMTFCLPPPMKDRLQEYSCETGLSEAEIIRITLREFFEWHDWKDKVDAYYDPLSLAETVSGYTAGLTDNKEKS